MRHALPSQVALQQCGVNFQVHENSLDVHRHTRALGRAADLCASRLPLKITRQQQPHAGFNYKSSTAGNPRRGGEGTAAPVGPGRQRDSENRAGPRKAAGQAD